jgi:hypothetical protein
MGESHEIRKTEADRRYKLLHSVGAPRSTRRAGQTRSRLCRNRDDYGPAHEQCWQMPWRRVGPLSHMPIPMTGSPSDQETPISRDSQWQLQDTLAPFDPAEPAADSSSKSSCGAAQPPQRCIPLGGACFGPRRPHCCPAPFPHHSLCSSRTGWGRCLMN